MDRLEKEKDLRFNFIFKNVSEKEVGKERERERSFIYPSIHLLLRSSNVRKSQG